MAHAPEIIVDQNVSDISVSSVPSVAPTQPVATVASDVSIASRTEPRDAVLHTYKRAPGEIVRGEGVFLYDAEGKRYLDFVSGIAVNALGYGDPGLVGAL